MNNSESEIEYFEPADFADTDTELDEDDFIELGNFAPAQSAPVVPEEFTHLVTPAQAGERIDKLLVGLRPDLSRAHIQRLIDEGNLLVNGKPGKSGNKLRGGEQ